MCTILVMPLHYVRPVSVYWFVNRYRNSPNRLQCDGLETFENFQVLIFPFSSRLRTCYNCDSTLQTWNRIYGPRTLRNCPVSEIFFFGQSKTESVGGRATAEIWKIKIIRKLKALSYRVQWRWLSLCCKKNSFLSTWAFCVNYDADDQKHNDLSK